MAKNTTGLWHAMDHKKVLENFESSIQGLKSEEAGNRLLPYGTN
jgi:hypothetical protein